MVLRMFPFSQGQTDPLRPGGNGHPRARYLAARSLLRGEPLQRWGLNCTLRLSGRGRQRGCLFLAMGPAYQGQSRWQARGASRLMDTLAGGAPVFWEAGPFSLGTSYSLCCSRDFSHVTVPCVCTHFREMKPGGTIRIPQVKKNSKYSDITGVSPASRFHFIRKDELLTTIQTQSRDWIQ